MVLICTTSPTDNVICSAKTSDHVDLFTPFHTHLQAIASQVVSGSPARCQGSRARQQDNELVTLQRTRRGPFAEQAGTFSAVTDTKTPIQRTELAPASCLGPGVLCEARIVISRERTTRTAQVFIGLGRSQRFNRTPVSRNEEFGMWHLGPGTPLLPWT